jgi:hypothetical protein
MTVLSCILITLAGAFSVGYVPPPDGVGSEILAINTRSLGMGGVSVGIPNPNSFTILNPAASAWALDGGVSFTSRYTESDDAAWDNRLGFPMISALIPLPARVVITGAIEGRSRIDTFRDDVVIDDETRGDYTWSGGLVETYVGVSVRANDWIGLSIGGRSTSGNIMSDVELLPSSSSPSVPENKIYRDDANFGMAWGAVAGLMVNTDRFGMGFSVSTDRRGTMRVDRMYYDSDEADSTSSHYTIPGELSVGLSFRPVERLLIGADLLSRKTMNILGSRTEEGSIYSAGAEYDFDGSIRARCGYSRMDGLWRDGAQTVSAGLGYSFGGSRAGLDLAVAHNYWRDDLESYRKETVFSVSLWASEKWLGN